MHEKIERAPFLCQHRKGRVDRVNLLDVTRQQKRSADRLRQRPHPSAERLALISEGKGGAVRGKRPGNAPGDGVVVCDPHDQPALALHQLRHLAWISTTLQHDLLAQVRSACAAQTSRRLNTTEALVPPKPNEFDRTQPSFASSRRSRMIGISANAGSRVSILALSQMKPLFIIRME